jgi:hypothetical protein
VGSTPPPVAPRRAGRRSASTAALSRIVSPWPSPERTSRRPGVTTVGPVVIPLFSPAPTVTPSSIKLCSPPARPASGAFDADDRSASFPNASASAPFNPPSAAPSADFRAPALGDRSGTSTAAMFPSWPERALGAPSRSSARDGGGSAAPTDRDPAPAGDLAPSADAPPDSPSNPCPWPTAAPPTSGAAIDCRAPRSAPEPPSDTRLGRTAPAPAADPPPAAPSDPRRRRTASSPCSAAATDRDPASAPATDPPPTASADPRRRRTAPSPRSPAATDSPISVAAMGRHALRSAAADHDTSPSGGVATSPPDPRSIRGPRSTSRAFSGTAAAPGPAGLGGRAPDSCSGSDIDPNPDPSPGSCSGAVTSPSSTWSSEPAASGFLSGAESWSPELVSSASRRRPFSPPDGTAAGDPDAAGGPPDSSASPSDPPSVSRGRRTAPASRPMAATEREPATSLSDPPLVADPRLVPRSASVPATKPSALGTPGGAS